MPIISILGYECNRCWYRWSPRAVMEEGADPGEMPLRCPKCKSSYWNRPRKYKVGAGRAAAAAAWKE